MRCIWDLDAVVANLGVALSTRRREGWVNGPVQGLTLCGSSTVQKQVESSYFQIMYTDLGVRPVLTQVRIIFLTTNATKRPRRSREYF